MIVPWEKINKSTLINLIQTEVSTEGTDNGDMLSLEEKTEQVLYLLKTGKAIITFDEITNSFSIKCSK